MIFKKIKNYFFPKKRLGRVFAPVIATTLIEMLIVVSLFATVSLVLYQALSNGFKIWERSTRLNVQEDIALFVEKFRQDLESSFKFSEIPFTGRERDVSFATIVRVPPIQIRDRVQHGLSYVDNPGRVRYYYDQNQKKLYKQQADYGQALRDEFQPPALMLSDLERVHLRYFERDTDGTVSKTKMVDRIPTAVEIFIEYRDEANHVQQVNVIVNIPVGV